MPRFEEPKKRQCNYFLLAYSLQSSYILGPRVHLVSSLRVGTLFGVFCSKSYLMAWRGGLCRIWKPMRMPRFRGVGMRISPAVLILFSALSIPAWARPFADKIPDQQSIDAP